MVLLGGLRERKGEAVGRNDTAGRQAWQTHHVIFYRCRSVGGKKRQEDERERWCKGAGHESSCTPPTKALTA